MKENVCKIDGRSWIWEVLAVSKLNEPQATLEEAVEALSYMLEKGKQEMLDFAKSKGI